MKLLLTQLPRPSGISLPGSPYLPLMLVSETLTQKLCLLRH